MSFNRVMKDKSGASHKQMSFNRVMKDKSEASHKQMSFNRVMKDKTGANYKPNVLQRGYEGLGFSCKWSDKKTSDWTCYFLSCISQVKRGVVAQF
jgi:hypothetical protein